MGKKFESGDWQHEINVRDFIQKETTHHMKEIQTFKTCNRKKQKNYGMKFLELYKKRTRSKGGVLDIDTKNCFYCIST